MLRLLTQPRGLLAISVIAPMLLCCCSGRIVGDFSGRVLAWAFTAPMAESGPGWMEGGDHGCCSSGPASESPVPAKDTKPCDCEQYREAKKAPESVAPLPSPLIPAAFDIAAIETLRDTGLALRVRADRGAAVPRPPDSLLRQHCALTI